MFNSPEEAPGARTIGFHVNHDLELFLLALGKDKVFDWESVPLWKEIAKRLTSTFPDLARLTGRICRERTI